MTVSRPTPLEGADPTPAGERPERYPPLALDDMYFEQRQAVEAVDRRRHRGIAGPFVPLSYAPGILDPLHMLGEHCRYYTSIPPKLRQWAICIAGRNVNAAAVLFSHMGLAQAGGSEWDVKRWGPLGRGIAKENIDALAEQRRPPSLDEDETLVYDFCMEIHATGGLSDALFERAAKRFGKEGVLELVAIYGHYSTLGLIFNVTQTVVPGNPTLPFSTPAD